MARSILIKPGKEHPNPCKGWIKMCKEGKISYEWFVCDCSMCERNYQIKINDEWKDIKICPFCNQSINDWSKGFKLQGSGLEYWEKGDKALKEWLEQNSYFITCPKCGHKIILGHSLYPGEQKCNKCGKTYSYTVDGPLTNCPYCNKSYDDSK